MTKLKIAPWGAEMKALLLSDEHGFRAVLQAALQEGKREFRRTLPASSACRGVRL